MRLFRKRETLNERLLREAHVEWEQLAAKAEPATRAEEGPPPAQRSFFPSPVVPPIGVAGRVEGGFHKLREYDAVVSPRAPGIGGDEVRFVALPDGSLLVEDEEGDAELAPIADEIETKIEPPYRAHAVRLTDDLWSAAAVKIRVLSVASDGDVIDLTSVGWTKTLNVDDRPRFGSIKELEDVGTELDGDYAIHAERLDGDLWEVQASPL